jgi:hypothetical protein
MLSWLLSSYVVRGALSGGRVCTRKMIWGQYQYKLRWERLHGSVFPGVYGSKACLLSPKRYMGIRDACGLIGWGPT